MTDIKQVAELADLIVNGYAFTKCHDGFRILNLNHPDKALKLSASGEVLETSMDDIEIQIVKEYLAKNRRFMEEQDTEVL